MNNQKPNILIACNDEISLKFLEDELSKRNYTPILVTSEEEVIDKLTSDNIKLLITDLKLKEFKNGIEKVIDEHYFEKIKQTRPNVEIIIYTGTETEIYKEPLGKISPYFQLRKEKSPLEFILLLIEFCLSLNEIDNNNKKGAILESLMEYIFNGIDGFSARKNVRPPAAEIDILINNEIGFGFWQRVGYNIPVECKNLSEKVDSEMMRAFIRKISENIRFESCNVALYISPSGFTSDIKDVLIRENKISIVLMDDYRIKEFVSADNRVILLKEYIGKCWTSEQDREFFMKKRNLI
ncbi:MAG: restriction endonuclease [bacterium]